MMRFWSKPAEVDRTPSYAKLTEAIMLECMYQISRDVYEFHRITHNDTYFDRTVFLHYIRHLIPSLRMPR